MSGIMVHEGRFIDFYTYLMLESFQPVHTQYGLNLRDSKWRELFGNYYTFFEHEGVYFMVVIDYSGVISFGSSHEFIETDDLNDLVSLFDDTRKKTAKAMRAFNKFFYVVMEGVKKYHVDYIKFSAASPALGALYGMVVNNKFFLKRIEDEGFVYKGKQGVYYVFVKE